jgi:hypothetical protein
MARQPKLKQDKQFGRPNFFGTLAHCGGKTPLLGPDAPFCLLFWVFLP